VIENQNFILAESEKEIKESRDLIKCLTGEENIIPTNKKDKNEGGGLGKLLVFKPLPSSANITYYTTVNNIITKNNLSNNGAGRVLPCANPIPKSGRYHYKFINRNLKENPNFRIGVISKPNLAAETYMNGGDANAVMYYCYCADKEILYEGTNKKDGFNINRGNLLTVVIDLEMRQVEWFVENEWKARTRFTESMTDNLFFFIQLWSNGDALEVVDH
jgi:hypothetical protein